ncbi:type II CAAX endopeptidase family protein [Mariniluteicoccus endophyticus]
MAELDGPPRPQPAGRPAGSWRALPRLLRQRAEAERAAARRTPPRTRTTRRLVCAATIVVSAGVLAWSLRIPAGDPMFYPATLALAAILIAGAVTAGRPPRDPSVPASVSRDAVTGLGAGAVLLLVFLVGAGIVAQVPFLKTPVQQLLDHASVGSLPIVLAITVVNGVAEELFYRRALYDATAARHPILLTTVVYTAVTALSGIPLLALAAALLGLTCALLRRWTRGIVAPMLAHLVWSLGMLLLLDPTLTLLEKL